MNEKTKIFNQNRSELINIAYGMMGDLSEAKDIVQDTYLRWSKVNLKSVNSPNKYLKTIVSRLCIDQFRTARQRREEYPGTWLPQPVAETELPDRNIELHDKLTMALLHILENLSADQRAIFLLHDVFGYKFSEIAELLDKKAATCRKAAQRARLRIRQNDPIEMSRMQQSNKIIEDFIEALRSRDIEKLQRLLADDAIMYSDGGGKANSAPKPIEGLKKVSKFLISVAGETREQVSIERKTVNNGPGFKAFIDDKLHSIWSFKINEGQIQKVFAVLNPDKLEYEPF